MTTATGSSASAEARPEPADRTPASLQAGWNHLIETVVTDRTGFLDGIDRWLGGLGERVVGTPAGGAAMDVLSGRWLGHALHPSLSDVSIGLWGASAFCDVVGEGDAAGALTAAGAAASLATAASGISDWNWTLGRERRLGLVHGLANVAGLGVQLGSLAARLAGRRRAAQALNLTGLALTTAAAYLGGELVLGRGTGVDHTAFMTGPDEWTPLLRVEDVEDGGMLGADLEGRRVLVSRRGSIVSVIENTCSHLGGPLDEGELRDGVVTCPWHGSRFRLSDGCAVRGPASSPQPRLQARVVAGRVEVRGREA